MAHYDFRLRRAYSYEQAFNVMRALRLPYSAAKEMFRRMVVNLVVDNKDDHAKNFSFICKEGTWSLAPAYDITYSPSGSRGEHATSLFYKGNPSLDDILKAGIGIRIPRERCMEIIKKVESVCEKNLPVVKKLS